MEVEKEDVFFGEYIPERLKIIEGAYSSIKYRKTHQRNRAVKTYSDKILKKCLADKK